MIVTWNPAPTYYVKCDKCYAVHPELVSQHQDTQLYAVESAKRDGWIEYNSPQPAWPGRMIHLCPKCQREENAE